VVLVCDCSIGWGGGGNHYQPDRAASRIVGLSYYWTFGVPSMIAGALICSFLARRSRVTIGYAPFLGQLITMVVRTGGGSMLPLGVIFSGFIGLTGVAAAFAGASLGKKVIGNPSQRFLG